MSDRLPPRLLYAGLFFSGACTMALEIVAGRVLAPFLGSSLYSWTSVIGVVLSGVAIGNYVGGRLSDRSTDKRPVLSRVFLAASLGAMSVLLALRLFGWASRPPGLPWPVWCFVAAGAVFLLPAVLLGILSPVLTARALRASRSQGRSLGVAYACGASGSILGTFVTGYVLLGAMGTTAIVLLVAATLAGFSVLYATYADLPERIPGVVLATTLSVLAVGSGGGSSPMAEVAKLLKLGHRNDTIVYFDESDYYTIEIEEAPDEGVLVLRLDGMVHSYVSPGRPDSLRYGYERTFRHLTETLFSRSATFRALLLGGGGFVFPRFLEHAYPGASIDVVELDPDVWRAAQLTLGLPLPDLTRINTSIADARVYVREAGQLGRDERFNIVYGDVFHGFEIPSHLTTREFHEELSLAMVDGGVYIANVIDVVDRTRPSFLASFAVTLSEVFPALLIAGRPLGRELARETYVVVAAKSVQGLDAVIEAQALVGAIGWKRGDKFGGQLPELLEHGLSLTDDFAPVEQLMLRAARTR